MADLEADAMSFVQKLLNDFVDSASSSLKARAEAQTQVSREEAQLALNTISDVVRKKLDDEQKVVSRCLVPHVRERLFPAYDLAMAEKGRGSVARSKVMLDSENTLHLVLMI